LFDLLHVQAFAAETKEVRQKLFRDCFLVREEGLLERGFIREWVY
jgi:hypothetical protein